MAKLFGIEKRHRVLIKKYETYGVPMLIMHNRKLPIDWIRKV
jgi:hypothetical protein